MPGVELSRDAEIRELDIALEALARTPRLASLLRYMADKYFGGAVEDLTEYNIATEVCGRSPASFVAGEDAIARVEVHRLRKKLRDFYENGGRSHAVHILIPPGTYIPSFRHQAAAAGSSGQEAVNAIPTLPHSELLGGASAETSAASVQVPPPPGPRFRFASSLW